MQYRYHKCFRHLGFSENVTLWCIDHVWVTWHHRRFLQIIMMTIINSGVLNKHHFLFICIFVAFVMFVCIYMYVNIQPWSRFHAHFLKCFTLHTFLYIYIYIFMGCVVISLSHRYTEHCDIFIWYLFIWSVCYLISFMYWLEISLWKAHFLFSLFMWFWVKHVFIRSSQKVRVQNCLLLDLCYSH